MNFTDKAIQLRKEGYTHYYDRNRQSNTEKCSRCNKKYSIESFAKNGDYRHYAVCVYCGGWTSLDNGNEYFYPPVATYRAKSQEQLDNERMFHYVHGLRLSVSYSDFKTFILAYTVCEIKAKSGKKPEGLEPDDIKKIAAAPSEVNVDKFFRRFYRCKPARRDRAKWINDLIKAAKRDTAILEFLESQGVTDYEKWYYDTKFPPPKPIKKIEPQGSLFDLA